VHAPGATEEEAVKTTLVLTLVAAALPVAAPGAASPTWQPLPSAPIAGRTHEGVAWTGKEMLVWGGESVGARGRSRSVRDAAAYEPAARRWRKIAPPPPKVNGDAVWTGRELLAWSGNGLEGPGAGAVYDVRSDRWRRLPPGPLGRGGREGDALAWTWRELIVVGGTNGDAQAKPVAAAVDPTTGRWRLLPALGHISFFGGVSALWAGHRLYVSGLEALCNPPRGSACDRVRPILLAYDPATDAMSRIATAGANLGRGESLRLVGSDRGGLLFADEAASRAHVRILRYAPTTGLWRRSAPSPCAVSDQAVWPNASRVAYVSPCSRTTIELYSATANRWRVLHAGRSPFTTRFSPAVVWTGKALIAWSGSEAVGHRRTPADGASITLAG
jgi:hypothetical protein